MGNTYALNVFILPWSIQIKIRPINLLGSGNLEWIHLWLGILLKEDLLVLWWSFQFVTQCLATPSLLGKRLWTDSSPLGQNTICNQEHLSLGPSPPENWSKFFWWLSWKWIWIFPLVMFCQLPSRHDGNSRLLSKSYSVRCERCDSVLSKNSSSCHSPKCTTTNPLSALLKAMHHAR